MKPTKLKIKTKTQSYNVVIGSNLIKNFLKILNENSINFNKYLIIADNKVPKNFIREITYNLKKKKNLFFYLIQVKLIKIKKVLTNY